MVIKIQRAEAKECGTENWDWETFIEVDSYEQAAHSLVKIINDNDAIGDFFRIVNKA